MIRARAYKTKLKLGGRERTWCRQCAGASRWCFNHGLAEMKKAYEEGRETSVGDEKKCLNAIKDEIAPWLRDVPYTVLESAFNNLFRAYLNFFRRVKKGKGPAGFPKFKSKRNSCQSFTVRDIRITETGIRLPRIGWLRLAENGYLPTTKRVRILSATVSTRNYGETWYVSIQVEEEVPEPVPATGEPLGIDLGIHALAVLSDGTMYENIKPLRTAQRKVKRLSKELARRTKGGKNWLKTKVKLNKAHEHAWNIRLHYLHQISSETVAKRPHTIVMEDLNISGMVKNHCLARAIADLGMFELRRQMGYKADWNGCQFKMASQWFPSSKCCSACGCINDNLTLKDRTYICPDCGFEIDRDLNAARNLVALA